MANTPAPVPAPAPPPGVLARSAGYDFNKEAGTMRVPTTITPEPNALVSDNLNKLIDKDSEYMQLAKTKALQQANARGLANSSIAVGAGQAAAIEAARPIAEGDASAYFTAQRENAAAQNQFAQQANQFGRDSSSLKYKGILDQESQQRDIAFRGSEADKDRAFKTETAAKDFANELEKMGYANKLATANVPIQYATSVAQTLQASINSILADTSISPEAKQNTITNLVNYSNATMSWAEKFYGGTFTRFSPTDTTLPPAPKPPTDKQVPKTPPPAPAAAPAYQSPDWWQNPSDGA